jgi:membrane-associated phospholipid phosphatase
MENEIYKIMDSIGYYGPIILCIGHVYVLRFRFLYLFSYLAFFCMNVYLNTLLKRIIREPRPENQKSYNLMDELTTKKSTNGQNYGMPSGHTQSLFYSISYAYLVTKSINMLLISLCLAAITIFQRLKYKKHTVSQLMMGVFFGTLFGTSAFYTTRMYSQGYFSFYTVEYFNPTTK